MIEKDKVKGKTTFSEKLPPTKKKKKKKERKSQLLPETLPTMLSQLSLVELSAPLTQANLPTTQQPQAIKPCAGTVPTVMPPQTQAWKILRLPPDLRRGK